MHNWLEQRAYQIAKTHNPDTEKWLGSEYAESQTFTKTIFEIRNFEPIRYSFEMRRDLSKPMPEAPMPAGLEVRRINKVLEGRPHIVDMIKNDEADLIVNTTEGRRAIADSAPIRASAEAHRVFYTTTLTAAEAICMALKRGEGDKTVRRLQDLHRSIVE